MNYFRELRLFLGKKHPVRHTFQIEYDIMMLHIKKD